MQMTCASLFAGCGGKTSGADAAGFTPIWAIERDEKIAQIYNQNFSTPAMVADILAVDPHSLEPPDLLLISPPCPNFSGAKANRQETELDKAIAHQVTEFIRVLNPKHILIENVGNYQYSDSFKAIANCLQSRSYFQATQVLNAADFGVPQNRKRLIVRASKQFLRPLTFAAKKVGWYEAIADLMPSLPPMDLAPWQVKRIEERGLHLPSGSALIERSGAGLMQCIDGEKPAFTIRAMSGKVRPNTTQANVWLVAGGNTGSGRIAPPTSPSFTIAATPAEVHRVLKDGQSYRVTPQAIARLQSFPDSFKWSGETALDTRAIGNAVPPLMAQRVIESFSS